MISMRAGLAAVAFRAPVVAGADVGNAVVELSRPVKQALVGGNDDGLR